MRKVMTRAGLGVSIITASLVLAMPASAANQTRWLNANQTHGAFYLGVAGGPVCNGVGCGVKDGTNIIVWALGQFDQLWTATAPGAGIVQDYYNNNVSPFGPMCLGVAGGVLTQGAPLIIWDCNGNADQKWNTITAESLNAPFPGCFVFSDGQSGQVMGVTAGNVVNGTRVIQWPLFVGVPHELTGWHSDQFWCPR
jgi:hypothetical protein